MRRFVLTELARGVDNHPSESAQNGVEKRWRTWIDLPPLWTGLLDTVLRKGVSPWVGYLQLFWWASGWLATYGYICGYNFTGLYFAPRVHHVLRTRNRVFGGRERWRFDS